MKALVRIVVALFVAALFVQTAAISKSYAAHCPPNCKPKAPPRGD